MNITYLNLPSVIFRLKYAGLSFHIIFMTKLLFCSRACLPYVISRTPTHYLTFTYWTETVWFPSKYKHCGDAYKYDHRKLDVNFSIWTFYVDIKQTWRHYHHIINHLLYLFDRAVFVVKSLLENWSITCLFSHIINLLTQLLFLDFLK